MLKIPFLLALSCFGCVITINNASAQSNADSLSILKVATAYAHMQSNFNNAMGPQSGLYNGLRYEPYDASITGSPYFMDATAYSTGSVTYDGYLYNDVGMYYDLNKDEVVISLYHSHIQISLLNSKLSSFYLLGHRFINLEPEPAGTIKPGYYDELYNGKIKVLARLSKAIQTEPVTGGKLLYHFTKPNTSYYILKKGVYFPANSEGSFMNVLKDKEKEIRQFIKAKKIKFRKNREQSMIAIAAYYDQLTI